MASAQMWQVSEETAPAWRATLSRETVLLLIDSKAWPRDSLNYIFGDHTCPDIRVVRFSSKVELARKLNGMVSMKNSRVVLFAHGAPGVIKLGGTRDTPVDPANAMQAGVADKPFTDALRRHATGGFTSWSCESGADATGCALHSMLEAHLLTGVGLALHVTNLTLRGAYLHVCDESDPPNSATFRSSLLPFEPVPRLGLWSGSYLSRGHGFLGPDYAPAFWLDMRGSRDDAGTSIDSVTVTLHANFNRDVYPDVPAVSAQLQLGQQLRSALSSIACTPLQPDTELRVLGNTMVFTSLSGKEVTLAVVTPHSLGDAEECVVSVRGRGRARVSEQDHTLLRELLHAAHLLYLGHYERSGAEYPPWWPGGYCARPSRSALDGAIVPYVQSNRQVSSTL